MFFKSNFYKVFIVLFGLLIVTGCEKKEEWISIFDGKSLDGWQASEKESSWKIQDGAIVTNGERSHLFYAGKLSNHDFKNFELIADVKAEDNSNSGIYFHTNFQESGWPEKGYECQVFNGAKNPDTTNYIERRMTGSLYAVRDVTKSPAKNNEWFQYRIVVQGKTIQTYINGDLISDYTEPENVLRAEDKKGRVLSSGTFALQCHDPKSKVYYKNIKVKVLPDDAPSLGEPLADQDFERKLQKLSDKGIPLADLHGHLKEGLTVDEILENGRKYGITYGIAYNCGIGMGFETNDSLQNFITNYKRPEQTYIAMQAEGREWLDIFSKETIAQFDYVFTDAMTWTNDNGKRMRLWLKQETEVGDPQDFMDQLVNRIETVVRNEPIDIYVNATYLPDEIHDQYDELWTNERMDKVIQALADSKVAMEISARYKIPSATFIKRAKEAGVKFTFGTNNTNPNDLGRLEYCIDMVTQCDLTRDDLWLPNK
jgi:hypothetical protein